MPTIKQKTAFKEVLSGSTITRAMKIAKYADTTASTTGKLTNTKGWQELMNQHLPDSALAKKHRELLNKKEVLSIHQGKDSHLEFTEQPHSDVSKALDMAYKLKGRYAKEGGGDVTNNILILPGPVMNRHGVQTNGRNPNAITRTDSQ